MDEMWDHVYVCVGGPFVFWNPVFVPFNDGGDFIGKTQQRTVKVLVDHKMLWNLKKDLY